jgi:hypothetical protein
MRYSEVLLDFIRLYQSHLALAVQIAPGLPRNNYIQLSSISYKILPIFVPPSVSFAPHLSRQTHKISRNLCYGLQQISKSSIGLLASWQNLRCWEDKSISSGISQFNGECIRRFGNIVNIVDTSTSSLVNGATDGAVCVRCTGNGTDGTDDTSSERLKNRVVGCYGRAGVAICCQGFSGGARSRR